MATLHPIIRPPLAEPVSPIRDDRALGRDEDLDRQPDGVPHSVVGLTAGFSTVLALLVAFMFLAGGTATKAAAVLLGDRRDPRARRRSSSQGRARARHGPSVAVTLPVTRSPRSWSTLAIVACVLVACHGPVHRPGEEFVAKLRFEGNRAISDDDLKRGLALERSEKHGGPPDPYSVSLDTDRIRGHYARRGFLDASVRARVDRVGLAATVVFEIEEGTRATTRIVIQGLPEGDLENKVRAALPLADGKPFDYDAYDLAKPALLEVVENAGYAHVKLDAQVVVDRAHHAAVVQLIYDTGPLCKFGGVRLQGVNGDLATAIDEREAFAAGDRYSTDALHETQRAIYAMNRFSTVRIAPDKTDGDIIPITISVSLGARHETTLGGGFGLDPVTYEARLRAGYQLTGWPGPLWTAGVDLRPAYDVQHDFTDYEPRIRALATLQRMDCLFPLATAEISAGYNYLIVEGYTSYGPLARLALTTPIVTQRVKLRVGWRMEYDQFLNISGLIDETLQHAIGLDSKQLIGAYEQTIALDLRDNPLETRAGTYLESHFTEGTKAAGGDLHFFEVVPELRVFAPISSAVIAVRARAGLITGEVPVSERFYAGGASSQRGFSERQLAPSVSGIVDGNLYAIPYGGAAMFDSSIELRQSLGSVRGIGVGGVTFLDAGDVTDTVHELDLGHLHYAAGFGLRLLTVVGAVRVDVGYRLNRTTAEDPEPDSHYAFHLSLGEAF